MRSLGAAAVLAVFAAFAIAAAVPFATKKRDYPASIPQASPLFFTSVVKLRPGSEACFANAVMEERSEEMRFRVGTVRRSGAPLRVSIDGPGYSQRLRVPGGYPDNLLHTLPVDPPARATPVRICIANDGRTRMDLYGAADRTRSRSRVRVDGRPVRPNVVIGFWERRDRSILERFPQTVERMAVMRAGVVGEWLIWPLAVLLVLGVPVALTWGYARSLRD